MNAKDNDRLSLPLFEAHSLPVTMVPKQLGQAAISEMNVQSILTAATGFMKEYDYTLNPYGGCSFGCTYCYAAFFAHEQDLRDRWGYWVHVKANAVSLLRRLRRPLGGKTIYMSSVTDPYQPIEKKLRLTRSILAELTRYQLRLVVQTRSPLVVRDTDLLSRFGAKRVNMTVTTDSELIRKTFEPFCPSTQRRLDAISEVQREGIPCCITLTPLLPVEDPHKFAEMLKSTGVRKFVVQPFHLDRGKFVAGTREEARKLFSEMGWDDEAYRRTRDILRQQLPGLTEGQQGFAPI